VSVVVCLQVVRCRTNQPPREAWQAISSGKTVPRIDPVVLCQEMDEAFRASEGTHLTDQFYCRWEALADRHGFSVHDDHGGLLPEVNDEITGLITAAIWFGVTTGYLALAWRRCCRRPLAGR
jgi:hypothetical protein